MNPGTWHREPGTCTRGNQGSAFLLWTKGERPLCLLTWHRLFPALQLGEMSHDGFPRVSDRFLQTPGSLSRQLISTHFHRDCGKLGIPEFIHSLFLLSLSKYAAERVCVPFPAGSMALVRLHVDQTSDGAAATDTPDCDNSPTRAVTLELSRFGGHILHSPFHSQRIAG